MKHPPKRSKKKAKKAAPKTRFRTVTVYGHVSGQDARLIPQLYAGTFYPKARGVVPLEGDCQATLTIRIPTKGKA